MQATTDRFITTHSGSLPRQEALVELQVALSRGEQVDDRELEDAVLSSTEAVIKNQIKVGIDIGITESSRARVFLPTCNIE